MTSCWLREHHGVRVWAHRGGGFEAPSNTIYAMERAAPYGLEIDLRLTRDLQQGSDDGVVVFHDSIVDNVTDGSGAIADFRYVDLAQLDAAHWWRPGVIHDHAGSDFPLRGRNNPDLRPSRLVDVLKRFPTTAINMDLKADGMEAQVAAILRRLGRIDDVVVTSFSERRVARFKKLCPEVSTGPGSVGVASLYAASRFRRLGKPLDHAVIEPPVRYRGARVDQRFVDAAHARGVGVHVWTVNDEAEARRLVGIGVDGIMTDRPSVIGPFVEAL